MTPQWRPTATKPDGPKPTEKPRYWIEREPQGYLLVMRDSTPMESEGG